MFKPIILGLLGFGLLGGCGVATNHLASHALASPSSRQIAQALVAGRFDAMPSRAEAISNPESMRRNLYRALGAAPEDRTYAALKETLAR